ncbi:MAG: EscU/YscU/HrcU family type III secretion system export apparatus switch protein [Thiotrichaceae bacterium]|nr:EscU/YscU/HrcU family type III secretion system export apparatus switch protein [Thiotrichaceae bacterium]
MNKKKSQNKSAHTDDNVVFKQAIALHYNEESVQPVPEVTATGQNEIALQIIELAKEHGIPIHEDPDLAVLLSQLELYEDIPESLYHVIAEVLAFAYIVSGKTPGGFKSQDHSA